MNFLETGDILLKRFMELKEKTEKKLHGFTFVAMETAVPMLESSNHKYYFWRQSNNHILKCKDFFLSASRECAWFMFCQIESVRVIFKKRQTKNSGIKFCKASKFAKLGKIREITAVWIWWERKCRQSFCKSVQKIREFKVSQTVWTKIHEKIRQLACWQIFWDCRKISGNQSVTKLLNGFGMKISSSRMSWNHLWKKWLRSNRSWFLITSSTNWHIENTTKGPHYRLKTTNSYRRAEEIEISAGKVVLGFRTILASLVVSSDDFPSRKL